MRKLLVSLCLSVPLLLLPSPAWAQEDVGFVVKGGIAWTDLRGDVDSDFGRFSFDGEATFAVGVGVAIPLGSDWTLRPEALFVRRRAEAEVRGFGPGPGGGRAELGVEVDTLEIPLLLVYRVGGTGSLRPTLFAGPSFGIKLDATSEERFMGRRVEEDISDDIEDLDIGIAFGGGLDFGERLTVDLRWVIGLTDAEAVESEIDLKWSTGMLLVGYRF